MSKSKKESPEETKPPAAADSEPPASDGWLSWLLLAIFLAICLVAWYFVHHGTLRGAPDAPVGVLQAGE